MKQTLYLLFIFIFINSHFLSADTLPDCPSDKNKTYHNCYGSHLEPTGMQYTGEWKNNNAHGEGTFTFANGEQYIGEYKNNAANGQGTYTYANGDKYLGKWKNDLRDGQGTYTFANESVKKGIWQNNELIEAN